jgi:hypothetical protein
MEAAFDPETSNSLYKAHKSAAESQYIEQKFTLTTYIRWVIYELTPEIIF